MPHGEWEPSLRDILIDRVRRGEIAPDEAEAEAAQAGVGPLATKPDPMEFNPDQMVWWSLPMAVAWIAWRTSQQVRDSCVEYRENWLEWFSGSWNVPTEDGQGFTRIDGYELKSLRGSTTSRLSLLETYMRSTETLPLTVQMTVAAAEKQLFAVKSHRTPTPFRVQ